MNGHSIANHREHVTFSLAALFEYATVCGILSALISVSGVVASVFLMGMALALAARQGFVALVCFAAASLSANVLAASRDHVLENLTWQRQGMVLVIGTLLCGWYLLRRKGSARQAPPEMVVKLQRKDSSVRGSYPISGRAP